MGLCMCCPSMLNQAMICAVHYYVAKIYRLVVNAYMYFLLYVLLLGNLFL